MFKKPKENIYGILSAPPCEHFSGSGARLWKDKGEEALLEGLSVVDACLRIILITKPVFWAMENPKGRISKYLGSPKHTFQPYQYGDNYSKRTCLWGDFNMPAPTKIVKPDMVEIVSTKEFESNNLSLFGDEMAKKRMSKNYYEDFNKSKNERAKSRAITSSGFAKAFYNLNK